VPYPRPIGNFLDGAITKATVHGDDCQHGELASGERRGEMRRHRAGTGQLPAVADDQSS